MTENRFSYPECETDSGALEVGLEGGLGDGERDRAPLTLQNENWISVAFFIDVSAFPSHYILGETLSQALQGKELCKPKFHCQGPRYHMELLYGSTWLIYLYGDPVGVC